MSSTHFTRKEDISRQWLVVDAKDLVVGRLCTNLAMFLMGKHKPTYTPHVDNGDYVIVLNADKVKFTGNKWDEKLYRHHTGFVKGVRTRTAKEMLEKKPAEIIRLAVKGMLPKNKTLSTRSLMKLKIYTGDKHPHAVQNPKAVKIEGRTGKVTE
jgi:large subunit ribosomal protein L13